MKILITGASGFIGNNLLRRLGASKEHECFCLTRKKEYREEQGVYWITSDITNFDDLYAKVPTDIDGIIHLAGQTRPPTGSFLELFHNNVVSTVNLLELGKLKGIKWFTYTSTGNIYGNSINQSEEQALIQYNSAYGSVKASIEHLFFDYYRFFNPTVFRVYFPYGQNQPEQQLIQRLANNVRDQKPISLNGCHTGFDLTPLYVEDLIDCIVQSFGAEEPKVLNLAGPDKISLKEFCLLLGQHFDVDVEFITNLDLPKLTFNPSLENLYNWRPKHFFTPVDEGIKKSYSI